MLQPQNGYVLVRVLERENKTKSGIYIPSKPNPNEPMRGLVVALPPWQQELNHIELELADVILFNAYSSAEIRTTIGEDEVSCLLVRATDILAREV
jgi:chaperonin GroES